AARRSGTHSTKNRAAVSGGGTKPWRQKGTGRARQGTIRAPQWAGGGVVFGPVPGAYGFSRPQKVRGAALRSAASPRRRDAARRAPGALALDEFSTKKMAAILTGLGVAEGGALLVIEAPDPKVEASARNLPGVGVIRAEGLNVLDVLRHRHLVMTLAALEA